MIDRMNLALWTILSMSLVLGIFMRNGHTRTKFINTVKYDLPFGSRDTKPGERYSFNDFKLVYLYYRELNDSEKKRKEDSIKNGIDGGSSVLSPFHGFKIEANDGKSLDQFELSILPYARHLFKVNGIEYQLMNSKLKTGGWILSKKG